MNGVMHQDDLAQMMPIKFAGRTSGLAQRSFGGLAAHRLIKDIATGDELCYDMLIEVREPFGKHPAVQGGDSGAWVHAVDDSGQDMWAGMIVGGDSQIGYAMPASAIEKWWQTLGLNLVIHY